MSLFQIPRAGGDIDLVLDIPADAALITFGIAAHGGNTWIDDLQLEVVGADVPSSGKHSVQLLLLQQLVQAQSTGNLAITTMPLSLDFELPVPTRGLGSDSANKQ